MLLFLSKDALELLFAELATPAGIAELESQLNEPSVLQAVATSEFSWIMRDGTIRILPLAKKIAAYIERPRDFPADQAAQLAMLVEWLQISLVFAAMIAGVAKLPASLGYEPLLKSLGFNEISARGIAHLTLRSGKRVANDAAQLTRIAKSVRFLAKEGRRSGAPRRHIDTLLAALEETSIFETLFANVGFDIPKFIAALSLAKEGDDLALTRLAELSSALIPHLRVRRGRKVPAPAAAHEFLLDNTLPNRAFSWNEVQSRCTDPVTEATRLEFGLSHFDPRPARRRIVARRRA